MLTNDEASLSKPSPRQYGLQWQAFEMVGGLLYFLCAAIVANWPILASHFIYPEQAIIYNANQTIHSLTDLVRLYTHPRMLVPEAPFFRPSGNFLLYQLLTPVVGWHAHKWFLAVNLLLQGGASFLISRIYRRLFAGVVGGYIAGSWYAMHPGLLQVRATIMHFDFAHIFFVLLSLLLFIQFCQKNQLTTSLAKWRALALLFSAIVFFVVAFTCKETALMLGPVALGYFILNFCVFGEYHLSHAKIRNVCALWLLATVALGWYLTLSWQAATHPVYIGTAHILPEFINLLHYLGSVNLNVQEFNVDYPLKTPMFPPFTLLLNWSMLISLSWCLSAWRYHPIAIRQACIFLFFALGMFTLLPIIWGMGYSWHLSLSYVS